jgi:hypothetical protein
MSLAGALGNRKALARAQMLTPWHVLSTSGVLLWAYDTSRSQEHVLECHLALYSNEIHQSQCHCLCSHAPGMMSCEALYQQAAHAQSKCIVLAELV